MPKRITKQSRSLASNVTEDHTNSNLSSMGEDTNGMDIGELPVHSLRLWIKEKFDSLIQNLESKKNYELRNLRLAFNLIMLEMPENLLNTSIGSDYEDLRNIFLESTNENDENTSRSSLKNKTAIKRKRSESARDLKVTDITAKKRDMSISRKKRSCSLDAYKTKADKQWLSALTSVKSYTVTKPSRKEDSGFSLKRIMKPDEEAISTCGSPLIVQQNISTPTVYIPLPGGVVMNIQPKKLKGSAMVPELDKKTKCQLKILCEQLNKLM